MRAALPLPVWCLCAAAALGLSPPARAAGSGVVEATGEAKVRSGDLLAARKEAVAAALAKAVEKVVGIEVQKEFSSGQAETVKGGEAEFFSAVRASVAQESQGFVERYDVLAEEQRDDLLSVTVRAEVFESKIQARARELTGLLAKVGHPKLMLVLQEVYLDAAGARRIAKESVVAAHLERELLARGFELRGARAARSVADGSIEAYDRWLDDGAAAKAVREQGAELLVAGRVEIRDKGTITDAGGLDALKGQTRIEIASVVRGVNASTGEVFSTKPVNLVSIGTDQDRALQRALKGRGNNVIQQTFDQLLEDLKRSLLKAAEQGQGFLVTLKGVSSYRKLGAPFLEAVKAVPGVSSVKEQSFTGSVLTLDVAFKGPASELQQRIFSALEKTDGFATLDIEQVSGKQLTFKR